jgi:hypothetical protein
VNGAMAGSGAAGCVLCIHGHFYQPPRMDPFTGRIPDEPEAAPYANWNERITAECYTPNAEAGHFGHISFNLGGTLAAWLDREAHATYARIVADARAYYAAHGVSNGLVQPVHNTILPLARRRDKICQVRWGIASFRHRFGHDTRGLWLPEMAVDLDTLQILVQEGIRFTILSPEQVQGDLSAGAGPYRVRLPDGGGEIAVFVRDRDLSNNLAFNMPDSAYVDEWLRDWLGRRCTGGRLVLIATDGETFGHHRRQGVAVLSRILAAAADAPTSHPPEYRPVVPYLLTTLGQYLDQHPPQTEVEIIENTAWSCAHRLERWAVGCPCTPGDSRWKGGLRRALDNLACDLDAVYVDETRTLGLNPWRLRDDAIAIVLGQVDGMAYLSGNGVGHLTQEQARRLLLLLEAQLYRQRMYASCAFFFEDLERLEPRYAIGNAVRAIALTRYATGDDLCHGFRRDLRVPVSGRSGRSAAEIFDTILARAEV